MLHELAAPPHRRQSVHFHAHRIRPRWSDQRFANAGNATVKNDIVEPQKHAEIDTATNRDLEQLGWLALEVRCHHRKNGKQVPSLPLEVIRPALDDRAEDN